MASDYYCFEKKKKPTRKARKKQYIDARNKMRKYPDCNYIEFYCDHLYQPENPWQWVDFRFFHTKLKRYFAVAMTTCAFTANEINSEIVSRELDKTMPYPDYLWIDLPEKRMGYKVTRISDEWHNAYAKRRPIENKMRHELNEKPMTLRPQIKIRDYGPVAIGVFAQVNVTHIDEHVIRQFIAQFRELGEPMMLGMAWVGEKVIVQPLQDRLEPNDTLEG